MTFASGFWMIFNMLKLEQIYNSILCNTMVLSTTIIIVSINDRVWPRNAIIIDININIFDLWKLVFCHGTGTLISKTYTLCAVNMTYNLKISIIL